MVMTISCKFEKSTYNTLASRGATRKSLHTVAAAAYSCLIHSIHRMLSGGYNNQHEPGIIQPIIKEVYGLTVLYRHIYAMKGTILGHFSRPKVTLKTIAKVNKLDTGTPPCTQPPKPFSIVSMQYTVSIQ